MRNAPVRPNRPDEVERVRLTSSPLSHLSLILSSLWSAAGERRAPDSAAAATRTAPEASGDLPRRPGFGELEVRRGGASQLEARGGSDFLQDGGGTEARRRGCRRSGGAGRRWWGADADGEEEGRHGWGGGIIRLIKYLD